MTRAGLARLAAAGGLALVLWLAGRGTPASEVPVTPRPATLPQAPPAAEAGFRSAELLAQHFAKHGAELGLQTEGAYLAGARSLRDRPPGGEVLEAVRADGVVTRFDRASGAFLAFDADGTIRTYFRPNDGERYFRRQLARGRSDG